MVGIVSFTIFELKFVVNVLMTVLSTVFPLKHFISSTETPVMIPPLNTVKDVCDFPGKAVQLCVIGNGNNKNPISLMECTRCRYANFDYFRRFGRTLVPLYRRRHDREPSRIRKKQLRSHPVYPSKTAHAPYYISGIQHCLGPMPVVSV